MSLSRAIALFVEAQPNREASRAAITEHFRKRWQLRQITGGVNTARRNGWIVQTVRQRPACFYVRTDVPTSMRYRAPGTRSACSSESGLGDLAASERAWASRMIGRFDDAAVSVRAASIGNVCRAEASMSLTGSAAAMCAGMLR